MELVDNIHDLRQVLRQYRQSDTTVGFVPTMGNLHAGHLALVAAARAQTDRVVVSIYVNPMQFGANEDLASYPRTQAEDLAALQQQRVEVVFLPDDQVMYPRGLTQQTFVEVPELGAELCGAARPGHFRGVTTVVNRLLNMVQPEQAYFGKKDYQQLVIIRRMVADLAMPVVIEGVPTQRAADGLALSSRNAYLSPGERETAPKLYQTLLESAQQVAQEGAIFDEIERNSLQKLRNYGFQPDYFSIRRRQDLATPTATDGELVALTAARLGRARLIDNLEITM